MYRKHNAYNVAGRSLQFKVFKVCDVAGRSLQLSMVDIPGHCTDRHCCLATKSDSLIQV